MDKQEETLLTVGIDLGTSTTQLILSELTVENFASAFTVPRIEISDKKVIYRSRIIFTPLINQQEIDEEKIKEFVSSEYENAGIRKEDIQMGAVIITGETARKANSEKVLQALSGYAGDFVVATAGPDLESIIAAKGAGTEALSKEYSGSIVNYDIGGGTSNLAVFRNGDITDTACFDIGGRLIKYDSSRAITYIAPKLQAIIEKEGWPIRIGTKADPDVLAPVISILVQVLENAVGLGEPSPYFDMLVTNHGLTYPDAVSSITFSGGVADCIEGSDKEWYYYGDIGLLLGRGIRESALFKERAVLQTTETIRATVVGAGSHTADVSGSTISYTTDTLPVKNVPVLRLSGDEELLPAEDMGRAIKEKLQWFFTEDEEYPRIAVALQGMKSPSFQEIQRYAEGIALGTEPLWKRGRPLLVIIESDMAKALGNSLFTFLPSSQPIVCIDSINAKNGDYVDIGMPVAGGAVLPVIIKTLVFN